MRLLFFFLVIAGAAGLNQPLLPYALVIAMAASASFATPISYQTNLMVYGPGGYRFTDFVRIGLPLNAIVGVISVVVIAWLWLP